MGFGGWDGGVEGGGCATVEGRKVGSGCLVWAAVEVQSVDYRAEQIGVGMR